ncbi:TPA: Blp family class II bacteriocin [Staphylococcus aureus]
MKKINNQKELMEINGGKCSIQKTGSAIVGEGVKGIIGGPSGIVKGMIKGAIKGCM